MRLVLVTPRGYGLPSDAFEKASKLAQKSSATIAKALSDLGFSVEILSLSGVPHM